MGLGTAVGITASGLKVTQAATSLVSANLAGASTDGYTAKRSTTQALYADTGLIGFTTTVPRPPSLASLRALPAHSPVLR